MRSWTRPCNAVVAMTSLLAAPTTVTLADIRLAGSLREAIASVDVEGRAIHIDADIDEAAMVRADERILPRALTQLIAAAVAKAAAGSTVVIATTALHGRVQLRIEAVTLANGAGFQPQTTAAKAAERGRGRDELPIWLARMLLELQGSELRIETGPDQLALVVELDEPMLHGAGASQS